MNTRGFISPRAIIHDSAFIGTNVSIFGATTVGPNCYIDDNVVLGYPGKERLNEMIKSGNVPTDLIELDKHSEGKTVISNGSCVRFGSVISVGTYICENVYCDIGTQLGSFCIIGERTQLLYGARIYNNVVIGSDCRIGGFCCNRSVIEDGVSMFGELVHSYRIPIGGLIEPSPVIRRGATIGWHAIIIGDIEIGGGAYVAAGAIVSSSVPKNHVVVGPKAAIIPRSQWRGSIGKDHRSTERGSGRC